MQIKNHIPNFITCLNLSAGCIAIIAAFDQQLVFTSMFIGIAILFDFLDGMAARVLHAKSDIGKQLDSLADIVSFGVAPGIIIYKLLIISLNTTDDNFYPHDLIPYIALLIPVFSALRLAKFNIDIRQTDLFYGLPTPANAVFIASLPMIQATTTDSYWFNGLITNVYFLGIATITLSGLLVSNTRLFSLKFTNLIWSQNKLRYIFLLLALLLIILLKFTALPLIIILYIILSVAFFKF
jgi:CDP-diacylglycerol--serine O-phosphatidyltransferase